MSVMIEVTYFVALPFIATDDCIAAGEATECFNPVAVVMRAEALSRKEGHVGAVAFSRTGDPATGDFSDAKVIRKFGDVPDDLSTLRSLKRPRRRRDPSRRSWEDSLKRLVKGCL
jgi:hypothetical protein